MTNAYNAREWVNFREIRARLRFEDVLRHHGVEIRGRGEQHQGPCPLPRHGDRPNVAPFSAHLGRGIFQCFGCGAKGNLLEFSALMSGVDPEDGNAFRKAMTELSAALIPKGGATRPTAEPEKPARAKEGPRAERRPDAPGETLVNAPLDFELRGLEHEHPTLTGGMLELRTVVHFGAGFCSRGMLKGKVAIPIHDAQGRLVGYAGADTGGAAVDMCSPAYSFPGDRDRKGVRLSFRPDLLLYNAHRAGAGLAELLLAPDPPTVWKLRQCGHENAVAPLGDPRPDDLAGLVASRVAASGRVWALLPDGDWRSGLAQELARLRFVRLATVLLGPGLTRESLDRVLRG